MDIKVKNKKLSIGVLALTMLFICSCSTDNNETLVDEVDKASKDSSLVSELPIYDSVPLPDGLEWKTNNSEKTIASSAAKKGGIFRTYMMSFPLTLRSVGPDSNGVFANYLHSYEMGLVSLHPNSHNWIPSLATHWAFDEDGVTVYYKLDPNARWSDGVLVTADDYMFAFDFMRSKYIVAPFYNDYYTNRVIKVTKYDDYTISITGASKRPENDLMYYYSIGPRPRHFHKLDDNWVKDYNWRVEPTTGPYRITKVKKGKYIEFSRIKDWWAKDYRLNIGRNNVDKIRVKVIRNLEIAFTHFLKGEIDAYYMVWPNFWYEKAKGKVYDKGYVHKVHFHYDAPQPLQGYFLNQDFELFKDKNVRYGFAHAFNVQKVIDINIRGDYERQQSVYKGYGEYSNTGIKAREFDLDKADYYFDLAGWDKRGPDGIRVKNGKRLSASVVYSQENITERLVVYREELKKAGFELNLDKLDRSAAFKRMSDKKHEIAGVAFGPKFRPSYWQMFHSENAHKPNTNNIGNYANSELDKLIDLYRYGTNEPERVQLSKEILRKIHDIGGYVPTYSVGFTRYSHWRWVKLPESIGTRMSQYLFPPGDGEFWIDEEEKQKTLEAMKKGEAFDPVTIIDTTYKTQQ